MKLYVKYMVSLRCKMMVQKTLEELGIPYLSVELGLIELPDSISLEQKEVLNRRLLRSGLEILDDSKAILIEKVKNIIIEMVHYSDEVPLVNFSDFLSEKLNYNYTYLANIFSEVKGETIEHYIIANKVERIKELLLYDELNLTEISRLMNYSSVAHLSSQFKKKTGLTPSYFKQLSLHRKRIALEDV
jgi:AraC-like DNA-binding protein